MNSSVKPLALIAIAILTLTASCSKKDNGVSPAAATGGSLTFTLSGDGYTTARTFSITGRDPVNNFAFYIVQPDYSAASVAGITGAGGDSTQFLLYFNGNKTTQQKPGDDSKSYIGDVEFSLRVFLHNGESRYYQNTYSAVSSGSINITKYGSVGDFIEGDFSGPLRDVATQDSVQVKNGHFKVARREDLPHE